MLETNSFGSKVNERSFLDNEFANMNSWLMSKPSQLLKKLRPLGSEPNWLMSEKSWLGIKVSQLMSEPSQFISEPNWLGKKVSQFTYRGRGGYPIGWGYDYLTS